MSPNISPETLATLTMIRRAARPRVADAPTKRPTGGRENPCATHREPRHGAAVARLANLASGRRHSRHQPLGTRPTPGWQLFSDAVLRGDIPVGVAVSDQVIRKAIGGGTVPGGMQMLALQLSSHRMPVRLRQTGAFTWSTDLA